MSQWEYAEVKGAGHECSISCQTPAPYELKIEPGEPGEEVPGILTKKMIARLGIAGWEMVNVIPQVPQARGKDWPTQENTALKTWRFKRLVQQQLKTRGISTSDPFFMHLYLLFAERTRQRWEYAEIQSTAHDCSLLYYRPSQRHGFTVKASEPDEQVPGVLAKKLIDQLALRGREVVSEDSSQWTWYLKHLLDEDSTPQWVEEMVSEQKKGPFKHVFDQPFEQ